MARPASVEASVTTLPCGLPVVHIPDASARAGIFGIAVRAGSRDESPDTYGLAHFVEHTIFKGTARRRSWHIINRMEAVGGELNAYTTKEETVVYSIFPSANTARAAELIADLASSSLFPDSELKKEREVVLDEIDSYLDTPSEAVFDLFEEYLYQGTSLAHNILGTKESVRKLSGEECRKFLSRHYRADNMVAFYTGPESPVRVAERVQRYFKALPSAPVSPEPPVMAIGGVPFSIEKNIGSHQSHTVLGICTDSLYSDSRYAVALLGNIVGGPGMNSLLNIALRERRGLVYSVEASSTLFTDCGNMSVYYGCDPEDNRRCLDLCLRTFARIASGRDINSGALARAKRQYLGQLAVASDNRESRIMSAARSTLFRGMPTTEESTVKGINAVSLDEIRSLAGRFADASVLSLVP